MKDSWRESKGLPIPGAALTKVTRAVSPPASGSPVEDFPDLEQEGEWRKRLLKKRGPFLQHPVPNNRVIRVAGHIQDPKISMFRRESLRETPPAELGQHHIGHQRSEEHTSE